MDRDIKLENRRQTLDVVRHSQPISRSALSKELNLSRSTISIIIDELINEDFVQETGKSASTTKGGRRPIQLIFNPNARYGLGIDIGGTKLLMVLTDLNGDVIFKREVPTQKKIHPLVQIIKRFIKDAPVDQEKIISMGIGLAGIIDSQKGVVVDSPNLGWEDIHLIENLSESFDFPIFINNDVNCSVYGEKLIGNGRQCRDFVFLAIGTGVGSAIIANNKLIEGHSFAAGEIGYFIDRKDISEERFGHIGEFGPFEQRASGTGLTKRYGNSRQLFQDCADGISEAIQVVDAFIDDIAMVIANFSNLLNPEKVIIGGGVAQSMPPYLDKLNSQIKKFTPIPIKIEFSALGTEACAIGASAYAFEQITQL